MESVSDAGDFSDIQQKFNLQFFEAQEDMKSQQEECTLNLL